MTMKIVDQVGAPCSRIRRMSIESLLFASLHFFKAFVLSILKFKVFVIV